MQLKNKNNYMTEFISARTIKELRDWALENGVKTLPRKRKDYYIKIMDTIVEGCDKQ